MSRLELPNPSYKSPKSKLRFFWDTLYIDCRKRPEEFCKFGRLEPAATKYVEQTTRVQSDIVKTEKSGGKIQYTQQHTFLNMLFIKIHLCFNCYLSV